MAYQIDPSSSESQYFCIPSKLEASLDLNLSQKTCQNSCRGLDEADCSHTNVAQANMNLQEENGQGRSEMTARAINNGDSTRTNISTQQSHIELKNSGSDPGKTAPDKPTECVKNKRGASRWKQKNPKTKQNSITETKKVALALGVNDDAIVENSPKRRSQKSRYPSDEHLKSKLAISGAPSPENNSSLDIVERRLLLDERKLRLAEQRFALEEKKLEATIEIGKGLIISMEKMTNTISTLGVPATHQ